MLALAERLEEAERANQPRHVRDWAGGGGVALSSETVGALLEMERSELKVLVADFEGDGGPRDITRVVCPSGGDL